MDEIQDHFQKDKRSQHIGYFRAELFFPDGSSLHVREFATTQLRIDRYTYVYHYQDADDQLIFRYDNTHHFPDLPDFPHHRHTPYEVASASEPDLQSVIDEILKGV
jgi:hypothetical protein